MTVPICGCIRTGQTIRMPKPRSCLAATKQRRDRTPAHPHGLVAIAFDTTDGIRRPTIRRRTSLVAFRTAQWRGTWSGGSMVSSGTTSRSAENVQGNEAAAVARVESETPAIPRRGARFGFDRIELLAMCAA